MNNKRVLVVVLIMFVLLIVLVLRLFSIQVTNHQKYLLLADKQQNKSFIVKAERGSILDRNHNVLAFTRNDMSLYVDTRMTDSKEKILIAKKLAAVFGKTEKHYLQLMKQALKFMCLEEKIPMQKALQFEKFVMNGFKIQYDYTRIYPYGSLTSHVLGYVDLDFKGVAGAEKTYDEFLTGIDGIKYIENDATGRIVTVKDDISNEAVSGNILVLTINKSYQQILESELAKGLNEYNANSAVGIMMNPNSGEILALANLPDYDPANYNLFNDNQRRNRAITDTYEPGSTIKPIILSLLFEENLAREDEIINTENGEYKIMNTRVRDTHPFSKLNVREIIEHSSNIGMAKLSGRVPSDRFYKHLRNFGFGNSSGIALPGEAGGMLKKPESYSRISKNFISFGYEISVTPLQLVNAFSALINGGTLYKPFIVKQIINTAGKVVEEFQPGKIRSVVSERTSDKMKDFMIGVVEDGTGKNARLETVLVGGKTGTSQLLVNGQYSSQEHNSSFVGFFPADNPKIICLIVLHSPKVGKYGGQVAAPIFREVAKKIVETDLSIVPEESKITRSKKLIDELFTNINSQTDLSFFRTSNIEEVKNEKENYQLVESIREVMPNLKNLSLREAVSIMNDLGLHYKVVGNGKVMTQSIEPGTKINRGSICLIGCETSKKVSNINLN